MNVALQYCLQSRKNLIPVRCLTQMRHPLSLVPKKSVGQSPNHPGWWWLVAINFIFPLILGIIIIPIDELIFFRGVAQPPTRYSTTVFHGKFLGILQQTRLETAMAIPTQERISSATSRIWPRPPPWHAIVRSPRLDYVKFSPRFGKILPRFQGRFGVFVDQQKMGLYFLIFPTNNSHNENFPIGMRSWNHHGLVDDLWQLLSPFQSISVMTKKRKSSRTELYSSSQESRPFGCAPENSLLWSCQASDNFNSWINVGCLWENHPYHWNSIGNISLW